LTCSHKILMSDRQYIVESLIAFAGINPEVDGDCALSFRPRKLTGHGGDDDAG